jgi:hypothetical protein
MLSRALILATVTLLVGCLTSVAARAENLDAGKSPSQIFSGTCSACHKSPRGLLKSVPASSLPGFLRQHYTTGTEMAGLLATYLISNGAADPRYQPKDQQKNDQAKQKDVRPEQFDRFGRRQYQGAPPQEAARPDGDAAAPQGEGARPGRDAKRFARPTPGQDANRPADGQAPQQAATDSKTGTKQKQGRRGKPAAEEPKSDETAKGDAAGEAARTEPSKAEPDKAEGAPTDSAKSEPTKIDTGKSDAPKADVPKADIPKADAAKSEADKPEGTKPAIEASRPSGEAKPESTSTDSPRQGAGSEPAPLRPDPAPSVTAPPPASAPTGGTAPEPAASPAPAAAAPSPATPPEVAATAPAPPPNPTSSPAPPISR